MFTRHSTCAAALSLLAIAVLTNSVATGQRITNNVSEGIHRASDLGRIDPTTEINITVQMKLRDEAAFNKVVDALYDPSSPTFHKWLTDEDLRQYAPSKEQYDAVRKELENHGLAITSVDENSFAIHARGTTANVESAFNTEIHQFQANGKVFRSNVTNARLSGAAGDYVSSVAGIESHQVHPLYKRALNPRTGQPLAPIALRKVQDSSSGLDSFLTDTIVSKATTFTFTTPGADLPVGVYFGTVYGNNSQSHSWLYSDQPPNPVWSARCLQKGMERRRPDHRAFGSLRLSHHPSRCQCILPTDWSAPVDLL